MQNNSSPGSKPTNKKWAGILSIFVSVCLLAIGLSVARVVSVKIEQDVSETLSKRSMLELSDQMNAHIDATLDHYYTDLSILFDALSVDHDLTEEEVSHFVESVQASESISYLAFVDEDGIVYDAEGSFPGTMRISMLGRLLNGETRVIAEDETISGESYIIIGRAFDTTLPLSNSEKQIRYALWGLTPEELTRSMVLNSDVSGGYASIINMQGGYVIKNATAEYPGTNLFTILRKHSALSEETITRIKSAIGEKEPCSLTLTDSEGNPTRYIYFSPIPDSDWIVVNTLPASYVRSALNELSKGLMQVTLLIIAIIVVIFVISLILQIVARRKLDKAAAALEVALDKAKEASSAKTTFLFNMSHDIRTPMNAILGYTDIGLAHPTDESITKDSFSKIKTAGAHLLSLINDILEMSRIESGKLALSEHPVDVNAALRTVTQLGESLALPKSIDFKTEIGEFTDPYVYTDELHINEVIINIISNAVKYTPAGGKVRYRATQLGPAENGIARFRFEVADTGIGMSEEFQRHLFEPFSRERSATVSKTEGAGIGLSIVKKIVDMAGGTIDVQSAPGKGTTFAVEIPFKVMEEAAIEKFKQEQAPPATAAAEEEDFSFEGMRVLLVEDNELNREIASYILEEEHFEVDTAEDGSLAVDMVSEKGIDYYDFILMDIQMPVMNGYEATAAIRQFPGSENLPIIALSANAFEEDKKRSIMAGMNAHVAKPIVVKDLLAVMRSMKKTG